MAATRRGPTRERSETALTRAVCALVDEQGPQNSVADLRTVVPVDALVRESGLKRATAFENLAAFRRDAIKTNRVVIQPHAVDSAVLLAAVRSFLPYQEALASDIEGQPVVGRNEGVENVAAVLALATAWAREQSTAFRVALGLVLEVTTLKPAEKEAVPADLPGAGVFWPLYDLVLFALERHFDEVAGKGPQSLSAAAIEIAREEGRVLFARAPLASPQERAALRVRDVFAALPRTSPAWRAHVVEGARLELADVIARAVQGAGPELRLALAQDLDYARAALT
jgi:hypothetical protein